MPLLLSATSSYLGVRGSEREEERREREREEEGGGNKTCIIVSALPTSKGFARPFFAD